MLELVLEEVEDITARVRLFHFADPVGAVLPDYTAGSHVDFHLGKVGVRSYSLIDFPGQPDRSRYSVAVQREADGTGGSRAMHGLKVGDRVKVAAPANDFDLAPGNAPVLLLAGGIGVTPLISMASALKSQGRAFGFHYAARSDSVMAFAAHLRAHFGDAMTFWLDDRVPLDLGQLMAAQPKDTALYICGPRGMIDGARAAAEAAGITDVHVELFTSPQAGDDTAFEVEIKDSGQVFTIPPGRSIIDVLEDEGVDLIYDCQRGDCGICQTDVIDGIPDHRDVVLSEAEKASGKVMQICVSRAKSARLVLDL